jgi:hypothetical protein
MGTASWFSVRPIFSTWENSSAFARRAELSSPIAASVSFVEKITASLMAVG